MITTTQSLLQLAKHNKYAVGAFNVYNLEGALAVIRAAEELKSPVMLQILPSALKIGGPTLIRLCMAAAEYAAIPASVHLDHCSSESDIHLALESGISSVMADGSSFDFEGNLKFTRRIMTLAQRFDAGVEAELGKMTGSEDGVDAEKKGEMTDPDQAVAFAGRTNVSALAVCIGNIHGKYTAPPELDFERLKKINSALSIPLVLHGTSGLPDDMIRAAVDNGVCKFNVNTEVRSACLRQMSEVFHRQKSPELIDVMNETIKAMTTPVKEKIQLFGSAGKAV